MHRPSRRFIIVSHRESIACGRAAGFCGNGPGAFCAGADVDWKRRAQREETDPGSCLCNVVRDIMVFWCSGVERN